MIIYILIFYFRGLIMSSKVSTDLLKSCRSMCERFINICNTDACNKFGINLVQFNNIVSICP